MSKNDRVVELNGYRPCCCICQRPKALDDPGICNRCAYDWRDQYEPDDEHDPATWPDYMAPGKEL